MIKAWTAWVCVLLAGWMSPSAAMAGTRTQAAEAVSGHLFMQIAQVPDTLIGWNLLEPLEPLPLFGAVPRSIAATIHMHEVHPLDHPLSRQTLLETFAKVLNVTPEAMDHPSLYAFIASWWQVPYQYGGHTKNGIDCSAFVQTLYGTVFGWTSLPRTARQLYWDCQKIHLSRSLKEGDLVFFRIGSRHVTHVGIYLKNNRFVHASLSDGVTISDLNDPYWRQHFICGGKPKN